MLPSHSPHRQLTGNQSGNQRCAILSFNEGNLYVDYISFLNSYRHGLLVFNVAIVYVLVHVHCGHCVSLGLGGPLTFSSLRQELLTL